MIRGTAFVAPTPDTEATPYASASLGASQRDRCGAPYSDQNLCESFFATPRGLGLATATKFAAC